MEYRQLGRSDLKVSAIGLGAVTFSREIDEATAFTIIDHALDRGINLIDTAEAYNKGGSETVVGNWLKASGKRNQIVLATKLIPPLTAARIPEAAEASLRRLQTDVIDLYQIHAFDQNTPMDESLAALGKLVTQGKVRYLGCSNFAAWQLCKALWRAEVQGLPRLESVQPNYNLAIRDIEQELLPLCADQGIGVISYSPLGAGFLSGKYSKSWTAPKGTRFDIIPDHWAIYENPTSMERMEKLRAKAAETDRSMIQLALAWVLGQPGITCTLVGSRNTEQVDQAFAAISAGLSTELRAELSSW
jgi:1-deoxyxylulose-5-phosphate synthase